MPKQNSAQILTDLLFDKARVKRIRTMREFAEQDIIIPDGPYKGLRFKCDRQPYSSLWFDQVGKWRRHFAVGPTQSGKTLTCFVIPTMYHLFEIEETVICGVPTEEIASDKWREDFEPAIRASRYARYLPDKGDGSRGGIPRSVEFKNGSTLKFMTAGGGDKKRAAFTSRVLVVTETDGFDEVGHKSREADKFTQLEGRLRAFTPKTGSPSVLYAECTVSVEEGRTWREYTKGSSSVIVRPCPHCDAWVTPGRDNVFGYQDAEEEQEAYDLSDWICPACGEVWSEDDRHKANSLSKVVHKGQSVDKCGAVKGETPRTPTLGFRWTAFDNEFITAGVVGADEWLASRAEDEDNAEKEMRQFVWALPYIPDKEDMTKLDYQTISSRYIGMPPKGIVPADALHLVAAIDLGKYLCHWTVAAFGEGAAPHFVEYGRVEVASDDVGVERALAIALREWKDEISAGWEDDDGDTHFLEMTLVDAGWQPEVAYDFCLDAGGRFLPAKGFGASQGMAKHYTSPRSVGQNILRKGREYDIRKLKREAGKRLVKLVHINVDHWKSWLHSRFSTPLDQPGAATVYKVANNREHLSFAKHLTSERLTQDRDARNRMVERWEQVNKKNHWLDAGQMACVAGHIVGARLVGEATAPVVRRRRSSTVMAPDGRAFFVGERD